MNGRRVRSPQATQRAHPPKGQNALPSGGLLAVLDDITSILDDVAAMSKLAARKTAGIVGDDLAVNANVVVGLDPNRELPIVGKIALGSIANKAVLIPLALALPAKAITPLLMLGGAFLCYEAVHKLGTWRGHASGESPSGDAAQSDPPDEYTAPENEATPTAGHSSKSAPADPEALRQLENQKVWGALGTDVILSAEVVAVALGAVADAPLATRALVLTVVGTGMTVGVYGLVAAIVKIDDLGLALQRGSGDGFAARARQGLGRLLVASMPRLMRALAVLGTAAMFTVGGGILLHAIPPLERMIQAGVQAAPFSHLFGPVLELASVLLFGVVSGFVTSPLFDGLGRLVATLRGRGGQSG